MARMHVDVAILGWGRPVRWPARLRAGQVWPKALIHDAENRPTDVDPGIPVRPLHRAP